MTLSHNHLLPSPLQQFHNGFPGPLLLHPSHPSQVTFPKLKSDHVWIKSFDGPHTVKFKVLHALSPLPNMPASLPATPALPPCTVCSINTLQHAVPCNTAPLLISQSSWKYQHSPSSCHFRLPSTYPKGLITFCLGFMLFKSMTIESLRNKYVLSVDHGPGMVLRTEGIAEN